MDKYNKSLLINAEEGPSVPPEVEQWGQLVAWLRAKDYTPTMVRATVLDYEEQQNSEKEAE